MAWAARRGLVTPGQASHAGHPAFAVFVLCLGVVVAALAGRLPRRPGRATWCRAATSFGALLLIALLATVLANLLTNLSATLLLVPMLAPLGTTAVLAALLGLNIGSGLTYTGSLANLLWRRTLVRNGGRPRVRSSTGSRWWSRRSACWERSTAAGAGQPLIGPVTRIRS